MSEDRRSQLRRLIESGAASLHPLTPSQRELWEASHVPPGDVSNHICAYVETKGLILPQTCIDCVQAAVARQQVMRLSILPGKAAPVQLIRNEGTANVTVHDLPPDQQSPEDVEEAMRRHFLEPFDMVRGPLYRVVMLRRSADDILLVFAIHHAIADGWSLGVFIEDLASAWLQNLLGRTDPLPPVPQTYVEWAALQRAQWTPEKLRSHVEYWRPRLQNLPNLFPDAVDTVPPSHVLDRWITSVPTDQAKAVRDLARQKGATLFSTLLAAFQVTVWKWCGLQDIVVGTPVANRTNAEIKESMGYCSGNVPLRGQVDPDQSFEELLHTVHETTLDGFAHAMPFADLVQALGLKPQPGRSPIYEIRFALQNHPVPHGDLPGLSLKLKMRSTGTSRFALGCEVTEDGAAFEVVWLARPDLISREELERLQGLFVRILSAACRDPQAAVGSLSS